MKRKPLVRTNLVEWDAAHFAPWVYDPVAQYLAAVYRGDAKTPGGKLLFTIRDLALDLLEDEEAREWMRQCLKELQEGLGAAMREREEYGRREYGVVRRRGKHFSPLSAKYQRGGSLEGERERYYLRIPTALLTMEEALGRVLERGVGFPVVALQVRHGKSLPIYLFGDAKSLYGAAMKQRYAGRLKGERGRPKGPWRIAYELERTGISE